MQEIDISLLDKQFGNLPDWLRSECLHALEFRGDFTLWVKPEKIAEVIQYFKEDPSQRYDLLMDLFAMDYLKYPEETPERFCVVYHLVSLGFNKRFHIKVFLPEDLPQLPSLTPVFKSANWFEREAWDLFGIRFVGHPNLTRILCHQDFVGHPLRKDYPADKYQRLKTPLPSEKM